MLLHRSDGIRGDTQFRALFAGMDEANHFPDGVSEINSATIGDINAEAKAGPIRDQTVAAFQTGALASLLVDNADPISVHLLRGNERRGTKPLFAPDFAVNTVQSRERLDFVARHFDTGNAQGEPVSKPGERTES